MTDIFRYARRRRRKTRDKECKRLLDNVRKYSARRFSGETINSIINVSEKLRTKKLTIYNKNCVKFYLKLVFDETLYFKEKEKIPMVSQIANFSSIKASTCGIEVRNMSTTMYGKRGRETKKNTQIYFEINIR